MEMVQGQDVSCTNCDEQGLEEGTHKGQKVVKCKYCGRIKFRKM